MELPLWAGPVGQWCSAQGAEVAAGTGAEGWQGVAGGRWHHHTGTRWGWARAWLVKVAGREEASLELMDLLCQDALLIPGQIPAALQLPLFFPEPLILQHELL